MGQCCLSTFWEEVLQHSSSEYSPSLYEWHNTPLIPSEIDMFDNNSLLILTPSENLLGKWHSRVQNCRRPKDLSLSGRAISLWNALPKRLTKLTNNKINNKKKIIKKIIKNIYIALILLSSKNIVTFKKELMHYLIPSQ